MPHSELADYEHDLVVLIEELSGQTADGWVSHEELKAEFAARSPHPHNAFASFRASPEYRKRITEKPEMDHVYWWSMEHIARFSKQFPKHWSSERLERKRDEERHRGIDPNKIPWDYRRIRH